MKLATIGECMIEMSPTDEPGLFRMAWGGDAVNTAVYAARSGAEVSFFTAIGDDYYSDWLQSQWQDEEIDCSAVRYIPGMKPALVIIRNDDLGQRSFQYWRDASPFRRWLEDENYTRRLAEMLTGFDWVLLTGIGLAMLPEEKREGLFDALAIYRAAGGQVAFDSNYRPRLWSSRLAALQWVNRAYGVSDLALPSLDDETSLRDSGDAGRISGELQSMGVGEVVIKDGIRGCTVYRDGSEQKFPVMVRSDAIDTTGAGDAFNAGYLVARHTGSVDDAVQSGQRISAEVVRHRGAIVPADAWREL